MAASANAVRYAKRVAKCERGLSEIPPRLKAVEREHRELVALLEAARTAHDAALRVTPGDAAAEGAAGVGGHRRRADGDLPAGDARRLRNGHLCTRLLWEGEQHWFAVFGKSNPASICRC